MREWFRGWWRWYKARMRLDLELVCELSKDRGAYDDFHDYPDDEHGFPDHMILMKCKRCGKRFYI